MWFLGAGASAAAGVPTAYNMIWEFKRTLYCAAQRVSVRSCSDLGNSALRHKLQQYFDGVTDAPEENADDEYAYYFEAAFPHEADRRRYLDQKMVGANPSYGHRALAALLKLDRARVIWTTNFDPMVEDAVVKMLGSSGRLATATLDHPNLAIEAINEGRYPLLCKIHGDFRSRRLKNTTEELRSQDAQLRHGLIEACKRFGLAVVGYSGRDASVIDALEEAIDGGNGYPSGLFWFQRSDSVALPRVAQLIETASSVGVDAHIVNVETFDELLADVLLLEPDLPNDVQSHLDKEHRRVSDAPMADTRGTFPVIRLNALPIVSYPTVCRLVDCEIGGTKQVREAIERVEVEVIGARRQHGVIAFGRDDDVRSAFKDHKIKRLDVHAIEARRLHFESAELGLLYDAFSRALERERPIKVKRARSAYLIAVDPERASDQTFAPLRQATQNICGKVHQTELMWAEALWIKLEYRLERLWLIMEPTIWVERTDDDAEFHKKRDFIRERLAARYNSQWNTVIGAWASVITNGKEEDKIQLYGIGDGIDAAFTVSSVTAFSRREVTQ